MSAQSECYRTLKDMNKELQHDIVIVMKQIKMLMFFNLVLLITMGIAVTHVQNVLMIMRRDIYELKVQIERDTTRIGFELLQSLAQIKEEIHDHSKSFHAEASSENQ